MTTQTTRQRSGRDPQ